MVPGIWKHFFHPPEYTLGIQQRNRGVNFKAQIFTRLTTLQWWKGYGYILLVNCFIVSGQHLWTILCALKLLFKKGRVVMPNVLIECFRLHVTSVVLVLLVKHNTVNWMKNLFTKAKHHSRSTYTICDQGSRRSCVHCAQHMNTWLCLYKPKLLFNKISYNATRVQLVSTILTHKLLGKSCMLFNS